MSSSPEVLYKRGDLNSFSKFSDKHKKQSSSGVLSKDNVNNFRVSFSIKLQAGNLKMSEAATGDAM